MAAADTGEGSGWIIVGAHFVFALVLSLQGLEDFVFEIGLLTSHEELNNGLVWLPVVGELKGLFQRGNSLSLVSPCCPLRHFGHALARDAAVHPPSCQE